jgi:hypothetical protein
MSTPMFGKAADRQRADNIKLKFAKQMGITLISIPFWWNKSPQDLASTILLHRPDINLHHIASKSPISTVMPAKYQTRTKYFPNTSKDLKEDIDPTGW